ncbi:hypothetical protein N9193_00845 [Pseudomonadales bacterium]|nr:hypothetical protein [Pseudomonadales bacterium]
MNNPAAMFDIEEEGKSLRDYINVLRRRKRKMAITAAIVMVLVMITVFVWPPTYRSESIILIEQQDIPEDLVRTTITSYAQQRIEEIKQRIMTIGNIMNIVEEYELYSESEMQRKTRTEIAQEFRKAVSIRPISAEVVDPRSGRPSSAVIAFSLAFDGDVPSQVQKVTNEITTLYLDENLRERTSESQSTSDFLAAEGKMLSEELERLDAAIAAFKEDENNKGALPEADQFNRSVVDRTESQINDLSYMIEEWKKLKIQLESDLTQLSPNAPVLLSSGQTVLGEADRLKALQTQLRQASAAYKEDHPTVVRLRREVAALLESGAVGDERKAMLEQLRAERDRLAQLKDKYTAESPQIKTSQSVIAGIEKELSYSVVASAEETPDNPAYLLLKTRLQGTEADIRNGTAKIADLRLKMEKYEGYLSRAPQVQKDFSRLGRDYQNTIAKYQEIRYKQMSAELAQNLETEQKGERFTLIQPPELPIDPVSPNRVVLVLLGGILAVGAGIGMALLLEALDDGIYTIGEVTTLTGAAPLVAITYMENSVEASQHNRKRIYIFLGLILVGVIILTCFHFFIKPLDVTWYILLRKLGIN